MSKTSKGFWTASGYALWSLFGLLVLALAIYGASRFAETLQPAQSAESAEMAVQEPAVPDVLEAEEQVAADLPAAEPVRWTQVQAALYVTDDPIVIDDVSWELPLGTHFAVDTTDGRYNAVESAPVGVVGGTDYGWCADDQLDCPPHALLVRVEVPQQFESCVSAEMDISWRIMLGNDCGETVPVRFAIRYNDQTRSESELKADYLALAGLTQQPLDTLSEAGLFVSVRTSGTSELIYNDKVVQYGFSCWDCLADTQGVAEPVPVPLVGGNFSTFGPDTAPSGSSLLPGVVFPLPRPSDNPFTLEFELEVVDASVVWAGRYDVSDPPG